MGESARESVCERFEREGEGKRGKAMHLVLLELSFLVPPLFLSLHRIYMNTS